FGEPGSERAQSVLPAGAQPRSRRALRRVPVRGLGLVHRRPGAVLRGEGPSTHRQISWSRRVHRNGHGAGAVRNTHDHPGHHHLPGACGVSTRILASARTLTVAGAVMAFVALGAPAAGADAAGAAVPPAKTATPIEHFIFLMQ